MKNKLVGMRAALAALAVVCAANEAQAQTATADTAAVVASAAQPGAADSAMASASAATDAPLATGQTQTALTEQATPDPDAGGTVAELQRLIQTNAVTELRTSYNGTYGASLLFNGNEMTYYVTLFQQKNFWRVIKTTSDTRAEAIYADFVKRTAQLSEIEIRRTKLEAQKAYTAKLIAMSEKRAAFLQADLDNQKTQQAEVVARQQDTAQQAAQLETQRKAEQAKLDDLRRQIEQLRQQTESGLPKHLR
jgi:vacuolar-type H+-ATPase subunit I/STV1